MVDELCIKMRHKIKDEVRDQVGDQRRNEMCDQVGTIVRMDCVVIVWLGGNQNGPSFFFHF